jgi:hypothetical protein
MAHIHNNLMTLLILFSYTELANKVLIKVFLMRNKVGHFLFFIRWMMLTKQLASLFNNS